MKSRQIVVLFKNQELVKDLRKTITRKFNSQQRKIFCWRKIYYNLNHIDNGSFQCYSQMSSSKMFRKYPTMMKPDTVICYPEKIPKIFK